MCTSCTVAENFEKLNRPIDCSSVLIANCKSAESGNRRTSLLGGMLPCVACNKGERPPACTCEVGDVILRDTAHPEGARIGAPPLRHLLGPDLGLERVHGLLDRLMQILEVKPRFMPTWVPAFVQGLCTKVLVEGRPVGTLWAVHPTVLERYGITNPCSAFEVSLEFPTGL
eukprot:m51a1_g14112 hypothetical protein (171) ;mRNA; f:129693-130329